MCIAKCKQDVLSVLWITFIAFHAQGSASHLLRENQYNIRKILILLPFLWALLLAQTVKNWPVIQEPPGSIPGSKRAPEKAVATHSSILPGESHGQRNLMGCSPWGCKRVRHNWATNTHTHTHTHTHTLVWSSQVAQSRRLPVNAGDSKNAGLIPGLGRSPGGGHVNPLQYSCLENSMGWGAWWATAHIIAELDTTEATEHMCVDS